MGARSRGERHGLALALGGVVALLLVVGVVRLVSPDQAVRTAAGPSTPTTTPTTVVTPSPSVSRSPRSPSSAATPGRPVLPPSAPGHHAQSTIFAGHHVLVAYYGTPGTGVLGVLGATSPATMQRRLAHAARAFARPGRPVRLVYEVIVSVADGIPGPHHRYSHDIDRRALAPYLAMAHRHHALVVLDIQPGRSPFLPIVRRWSWALREPFVGLALDPEWRMHGREVPGHVVGHTDVREVNGVTAWLTAFDERHQLPEKLFLLHEFRTDMIRHLDRVRPRPGLAMVQHVDGFGTPEQKRATFHAVASPSRFFEGFKLFYRQDVHRMSAADVHRLHPTVRFVSFQ